MTRHRGLDAALGIAVICGLVAAFYYWRYAAEWLRPPARISRCATAAGRALKKPVVVSGTEPHQTPEGETVYLAPAEDMAVRCVQGLSSETARRLADAFSEQQPELRGLELLKILRDVPPGEENDRMAHTIYRITNGAMDALPALPETKAAADELDELYGCRFDTPIHCPRRPRMPWPVFAFGIPAALAFLFAAVVGTPKLFRAARSAIAAWRARRKAKPATPPREATEAGDARPAASADGARADGPGDQGDAPSEAAAPERGASVELAGARAAPAPDAAKKRKKSKRPPPASEESG
jgi:hypothetical protein